MLPNLCSDVHVWGALVTPMPAHIMPESISGRGGFRIVIALAAALCGSNFQDDLHQEF